MSHNKRSASSLPTSIRPKLTTLLSSNGGLTMVELIVVALLLGILTLLALPAFSEVKLITKNARAMRELREIEKALTAYALDRGGGFPDNLALIHMDGFRDPWGNPYEYQLVSHRTNGVELVNSDFDLYSKGPDGQAPDSLEDPLSADDVIRGGNGHFMGTVDDYLP